MPTFLVCRILLQKFSNSFLEFILFDVNILSKCISATLTAHLNIDTMKQLSSNNKLNPLYITIIVFFAKLLIHSEKGE